MASILIIFILLFISKTLETGKELQKKETIIENFTSIKKKIIAKLKNYEKIMINNNLYELKPVNNGDNLEISGCNDKIDNGSYEYFFYVESKDNKGNTDKTFAGNTYNIFAKNQTVEGEPQIQQFYHGGSGRKLKNETKKAYNQDLIKEKQSFTLFGMVSRLPLRSRNLG